MRIERAKAEREHVKDYVDRMRGQDKVDENTREVAQKFNWMHRQS